MDKNLKKAKDKILNNILNINPDYIDKYLIISNPNLLLNIKNNKKLNELLSLIDFDDILLNKNIKFSDEFILKYENSFNLMDLLKYQNLSENYLEKILINNKDKNGKYNVVIMIYILEYQTLSEEFIYKYMDFNNKDFISILLKHQILSERFIISNKFFYKAEEWELITEYQELSEEFIEKLIKSYLKTTYNYNREMIHKIFENQKLSKEFIKKYENIMDISDKFSSSKNKNFSEEFLIDFYKDDISKYIENILRSNQLSENFLKENIVKMDKFNISLMIKTQKLSSEFLSNIIEEYADFLDVIIRYQKVDEKFIEKHIDFKNENIVNEILKRQTLSEEFIEKHIDLTDVYYWYEILKCQKVSEKIIIKYWKKLNKSRSFYYYLSLNQNLSKEFIIKNISNLYLTKNLLTILEIKSFKNSKDLNILTVKNQNSDNEIAIYNLKDKNDIINYFIDIEYKKINISKDRINSQKQMMRNDTQYDMIL